MGTLTEDQLREIAEIKMPDLNANDIEAAMEIVAGTARSMGVRIEGREMKKTYVPSKKLAAILRARLKNFASLDALDSGQWKGFALEAA